MIDKDDLLCFNHAKYNRQKNSIEMEMLKRSEQNRNFASSNLLLDAKKFDIAQAAIVLKKLAGSWNTRAQVRKLDIDHSVQFHEEADDFLIDLLPFKDHPFFLSASDEIKKKVLSCGWIIYNQKTVAIETEIINPACVDLLAELIPGVADAVSKQIVSETMVDESYHVLLVLGAINITSQKRGLFIKAPSFNLVNNMRRMQGEYSFRWQKSLIQLATAIVSEIFISDYLKLLSENEQIQPINRYTVKVHREDELAHSNIFKNLSKCIYVNLNKKEKEFLAEIIAKPVKWFADRELDAWRSVLEQIKFDGASQMIADCKHINSQCLNFIDYSELISLADEIGLTDIPVGLDSFYKEGLIV